MMLTTHHAADLVNAWLTDPIDRWRIDAQRRRFIKPAKTSPATDQRHSLGSEAVATAGQALAALGYASAETSHKAPYDLLVNDCLKIEVKAARWTDRAGGGGRYQADLKRRQRLIADLVLFGLKDAGGWQWLVIPADDITSRTLTVTSRNLSDYAGKYRPYVGAWSNVAKMLARVSAERDYQLTLEVLL